MIYFTSDQHFGHANIIKYCQRPYTDVYQMNQSLIDNYNEIVQDDDEVYMLGDISMNSKILHHIMPQLKGIKHLIIGNHDSCFPLRKKHLKNQEQDYEPYFETINRGSSVWLDYKEITYILNHFPYKNIVDEYDDRYSDLRPEKFNVPNIILLCGHVHEKWKTSGLGAINVGVDVWNYRPVSIEEIYNYHHGSDHMSFFRSGEF